MLEARDEEVTNVLRLFENYKMVMENNERKLKTLLDEYEVASRNYDSGWLEGFRLILIGMFGILRLGIWTWR